MLPAPNARYALVLLLALIVLPAPVVANENEPSGGVSVPQITTGAAAHIDAANRAILTTAGSGGAASLPRTATPALKNALAARKAVMEQLAAENPNAFLSHILPTAALGSLPSEVRDLVEAEGTVTGVLTAIHIDDFKEPNNSRYLYLVSAGAGSTLLVYPSVLGELLPTGTRVTLRGYRIGNVLVTKREPGAFKVLSRGTPKIESLGVQRTLVIPIKDPSDTATYASPAEITRLVFRDGFQDFFAEQSYGKVSFKGLVTDWVSVPGLLGRGSCLVQYQYAPEIATYLTSHNINLADYARLVLVVGGAAGGCSELGESDHVDASGNTSRHSTFSVGIDDMYTLVQNNSVPFKWNYFEYVLSHEMGHALGVLHANSWYCGSVDPLYGTCRHIEYGNDFDTMGFGNRSLHFNAYYKYMLGWITPAQTTTVSKNGTFALKPLETNDTQSLFFIKNPALSALGAADTPYIVEYRLPIGYDRRTLLGVKDEGDSASPGVFVNWVIDNKNIEGALPYTRLINTDPITWDSTLRPQLNPGKKLVDVGRGITLETLSAATSTSASSTARVRVTLSKPECKRFAPYLSTISTNTALRPGDYASVAIEITSGDYGGCEPGTYTFTVETPLGWELVYGSKTEDVEPGRFGIVSAYFKVPETTPAGTYSYTIRVANSNGAESSAARTLKILPPLHITSIKPKSGPAGTTITLTGTGFDTKDPYLNGISIYQPDLQLYADALYGVSPNGKTLSFTFPTSLYTSDWSTTTTTPPGTYTVVVGNSNNVQFKVQAPKPAFLGSSLLAGASTAIYSIWDALWPW